MGDDIKIVDTGAETTRVDSSTTSIPDRERQSVVADGGDEPFVEPATAYVALLTHYTILVAALCYAMF